LALSAYKRVTTNKEKEKEMNVIESIATCLGMVANTCAVVVGVVGKLMVYCLDWVAAGFSAIAAACR